MVCRMGTVFLSNRGSRQFRTLGFLLCFDICSICMCVPVYVRVYVSSHVWRPEPNVGCLPPICYNIFLLC